MDRIGARKTLNRLKAKVEQRRSPVRRDPETVPLADALRAYWDRDMTSFAIPAHHGGRGPAPAAAAWMGLEAFRHDLPLSHGLDTRSREWKVQATAQELAADAFG